MLKSYPWLRGLIAGLAGGITWYFAMVAFFGPAQAILTNPDLQSAKVMAAFNSSPIPRVNGSFWLLPIGLVCINILWSLVYIWISSGWPGPWWRKGLRLGVVGWVFMVPWFEFYLPWNVLHEPAPLVALELACWAGVILCVALSIAAVDTSITARVEPALQS